MRYPNYYKEKNERMKRESYNKSFMKMVSIYPKVFISITLNQDDFYKVKKKPL